MMWNTDMNVTYMHKITHKLSSYFELFTKTKS